MVVGLLSSSAFSNTWLLGKVGTMIPWFITPVSAPVGSDPDSSATIHRAYHDATILCPATTVVAISRTIQVKPGSYFWRRASATIYRDARLPPAAVAAVAGMRWPASEVWTLQRRRWPLPADELKLPWVAMTSLTFARGWVKIRACVCPCVRACVRACMNERTNELMN